MNGLKDLDNININNLNISTRLKNVLITNKIITLNQLMSISNNDIRKFEGIGKKTMAEVRKIKKTIEVLDDNPNLIDEIVHKPDQKEYKIIDIITDLETKASNSFIDANYSSLTFNDLKMSVRLKNCMTSNGINTVCDFLKEPIINIKSFRNLGRKSFEEAMKIKAKYLDESLYNESSNILYSIINNIASDESKSSIFIKNYLINNTDYNIDNYINDLNKLKEENKIETDMNGIKIKKQSIVDFINDLPDEKLKKIMGMRIMGLTLEEIGKKTGVTRERIRQITTKCLNKVPDVRESKYKNIFEKYNFSLNDFCKIFNESFETYYYLKLKYDSGEKNIIDGIDSNDFNEFQKDIIRKLNGVINVMGHYINKSKRELIDVLAIEYGKDGMTIEEITKLYNNLVNNNPDWGLLLSDDRAIEGLLSRNDNILFDFGRKFRYYHFFEKDDSILEELFNSFDLADGYYSTLVIFNNHKELMKSIDIRNEYELHSFMKKIEDAFESIRMDRTPNFSVGGIRKEEFILTKIKELAPISISEFLNIMEKDYGHKQNTFSSYLIDFSQYINGNYIDSDIIDIDDDVIESLKQILVEPIYSLELLTNLLIDNGYDNYEDIITKNALFKIGYKIRSSYILRKDYDSVEDYYTKLSNEVDFIPDDNILNSSTYAVTIKRVEKNYDIVSISDKEFITIKKLKSLGINKELINKFCNDVYECFKNITYFSVHNVKDIIDNSWIEDSGFDDIFYECLIETIDNIKYLRINNNKIYSFNDDNVEVEDIINEFMVDDSIYVDELIDDIKDKYGINVSQDKLIYSNKFYSKDLNKLYTNKESYYKEVYNYE